MKRSSGGSTFSHTCCSDSHGSRLSTNIVRNKATTGKRCGVPPIAMSSLYFKLVASKRSGTKRFQDSSDPGSLVESAESNNSAAKHTEIAEATVVYETGREKGSSTANDFGCLSSSLERNVAAAPSE